MGKKKWVDASANDFIAESLHKAALSLPDSQREIAAIWHKAADEYRNLAIDHKIRVEVEEEDFSQAAARIVREATQET